MAGFDWRTLLSGISSALPQLEASRVSRKREGDLRQGNAAVAGVQQRADTLIGDEVAKLAASNPDQDAQRSLADYSVAISRARAAPGASTAPNLGGQRFKEDTKAANTATAQYGRTTSDLVSKIDAPARQREREQQSAVRTGSDLQPLAREASTARFLASLQAQRRRQNPWVALLAKLGSNIANNYEPTESNVYEGGISDYIPPPSNERKA